MRLGAADCLSFAAAPVFAVMALLTAIYDDGPHALCMAAQGPAPLGGMVSMYLLMSIVHSAPWLRRLRGRRSHA